MYDRLRDAASPAPEPPLAEAPDERLGQLLALAEETNDIDARRARDYAIEAGSIAADLADEARRAEALYWEGCALDHLLEHDGALAAFQEALGIAEARTDDPARARLLRAIGFTYDQLGDVPQALDNHLAALEIEEALGNDAGRAATLRTIGVVYSRSGDPQTGLDYFSQSLALCERMGDDVGRAKTLNNIGVNLNDLRRHEESLAALQKALALYEAAGLALQQSGTLVNLGLTLEKLGRPADAEASFHRALALAEATGHMYCVVDAMLSLGRLAAAQGRTADARARLETALAGALQFRLKQATSECHDALASLHERCGDHAKALSHYREFHALEREVLLKSSERQLKAVQTRYQLAAAQREAEIHRLRHVELADANAELEQLNNSLRAADEQKTRLLERLERQTYEDSLTGLPNRRLLEKRFADEFSRAARHTRPLAVALIDVDHFKRINDRHSHAVGDAALRELARLLAASVRHTDFIARLGGEEFVMLLVETDAESARAACEKLRETVAAHDWKRVHTALALTVSIGYSADTAVPGFERMLAVADRHLYVAKARGRNCVVGTEDDRAAGSAPRG
jgi:diguanylate cyclase (GGDEF)-like protein